MNKKDYDLKLWCYIQSESSFFDLPNNKVTQLLNSDNKIDAGISIIKYLFSKITEDQLENEYLKDSELSFGANESIIYWDRSGSDQYIYKLTDPKRKSFDDRFNEIIMYYILQDYLFTDCKYDNLKICRDKMFVRQRRTKSQEPSNVQIESCMNNTGYHFSDETLAWMIDIEDISVRISDLSSANCRIKDRKLEVIDPRIRIYYGKL